MKAWLLGFLKPLILAHVQDLSFISPLFAGVLVNKAKLDPTQANALAGDLVAVVETEIASLINKI